MTSNCIINNSLLVNVRILRSRITYYILKSHSLLQLSLAHLLKILDTIMARTVYSIFNTRYGLVKSFTNVYSYYYISYNNLSYSELVLIYNIQHWPIQYQSCRPTYYILTNYYCLIHYSIY